MSEYVLDSGTDLGREQLEFLEELLDGPTAQFIESLELPNGGRCLDVGAGNGSMTRWLAGRVSSPERVSTLDLEDTHLVVPPGVSVHRHDVNDGLPTRDRFDLIHTRLLLMHLRRRRAVLAELADALELGGRLVVAEFAYAGVDVLSAPSAADEELVRMVVDVAIKQIGEPAGIDYGWAGAVAGAMAEIGLEEIDTMTYHRTVRGGGPGMLLYGNYVAQLTSALLELGVTAGELERFHDLTRDPRLCIWLFPFHCTAGGRPHT